MKCKIYFLGFLLLIPFTIILIIFGPSNLYTEQSLIQKLTEYQMKIQYLESLYRARQEDLSILTHLLGTIQSTNGNQFSNMSSSFSENNTFYLTLSSETRAALKNISSNIKNSEKLRLPNAYNFLPHLLDEPSSLKPLVHVSAGRTGVTTVLGVPTVKRDKQSYLSGTLTSLIDNMSMEERNDSLIIVFIGDTDSFYINSITKDIETQ
uniref:MGAT4 conserved region domain-containing protein n=1 Tax=Megaselia scalaris TaxID=36166 RepID=T1GZQ8_MEGSC